jgi:hypothetical protein
VATLTNLESKLAEVLGLAMAAQGATRRVAGMLDGQDDELKAELERMRAEARETEERCTAVADRHEGRKTAILASARETRAEATEMMRTYLAGEDEPLDGFEFLTMAEAGEVGHWAIVEKLNEQARDPQIGELVEWVLPIQLRHYETVLAGSVKLAGAEDPNAIES